MSTIPDTERQQCGGCGSLPYERATDAKPLRECPHCGGEKCAICDMGDDVECGACDLGENE